MPFFNKKTTVIDWLGNLISGADLADAEKKAAEEKLKHAAIKEMALYTSVTLIADLIAGCKIRVFEDNKPVENEKWYVFNVSANPNQTPAQLISDWITKMYVKGEALIVPLSKNLYVADSFAREEYPVKGDVFKTVSIGNFQSNKTFKADGVYYLRQNDPRIKQLLDSCFKVYADLLEYSKKASGQGSGEKYSMQLGRYSSGTLEEEKAYLDSVQERLSKFVSAESAALPLTKDQTTQRLSSANASNSSTDYTSLRKDVYNIAAEILHLPTGLLDGSLTSVDQVLNQALTTAIDPLVNKINQELTRKTYSRKQVMEGCRVFIDVTSIRHVDVIDKANEIYNLVASGLVCIDEARELCRLPELNTDWSEKHYITKNYEGVGVTDPLEGGE